MRKRMMAFLMALLMVVTILPANFTIVEANDTNGAIYLKVTGASDWTQADNIKVTVTDSTGKEVEQKFVRTEVVKAQTDSGNTNPDNTNPDNTDSGNNNPGNTDTGKDDAAGKDTENTGSESGSDNSNEPAGQADEQQDAKLVAFNSIKIDVTGLLKDSKYSVDISSDEYLSWKKECTAVEASDSPVYTEVAMVKDTYKEFAFSTDFNGWKLDTTPILAVKGADNNSVIKYASSDQEIADVDETTDVVNIKKAGKVSFTATLSVGDSYKTITQSDVAIAKLDQTLSFTDAKTEVYVGDEVATAASSSANDAKGKITYSVVNGEEYITIKIDITAPTIEVSYDNNSGDTTFGDDTYFKESRTATVKVTERNFDPAKVIPVIEASAGGVPSISGWTTVSGSGNGDDTVNIATIYYGNDADYTFNISAEDIAGNKNGDVNYGNSLAPTKFTVDKTAPVISVAYDNNNAAEAGFYKEQRTATVTIQEHNFETSRVVLTMNATDNGNPASAPTISGWSGSGDTHTATISFASDAVYTWTLAYTDKAGNKATDLENQSFCVDLTKPAITISGINPNSANNTDGNIGFAIECTDTNFGTFTPVLTAVVYENGSFATKEIEGSASSVGNGERIEYGNLEEDGMYSLRCAAVDKAGNAYDTVNIVDEDGVSSTVNLQDGDNLIDFSVNRNGSTFALNDYSMDVVNDYYVQETAEDIVFFETNADELLNYNIKLNGNALKEGNDYKVTESGGDGSWYRYEYAVNKSLFDDEGEYNLVVESEDKATSMAYSDLKNVSADFVIDKTAPTFTISGIEEDGNYRGTSQNVTLVPTDDGGKLGHVKVTILDKDGKEQKVISDMSGDELTKYLNGNDGKIKFKVPEGVNQQVAILCADCSIGTDGGTNTTDFIYKGITVSSNAFILFFENKPLFYGVLGVVAAAIIVPTGFVIYKKKRKTKKEASEQ